MSRKVFGKEAGRRELSVNEQNALDQLVVAHPRAAHGWTVSELRYLVARGFVEVVDAPPVQRRRLFRATEAGVAERNKLRMKTRSAP